MMANATGKSELDRVLTVVGNPTRRKIIHRLSHEASYPLELSAELGVHQQLITKHLRVMEEAELVEVKKESSPFGPDRKVYGLARSISVAIDFSPDLYNTQMFSFEKVSPSFRYEEVGELEARLDELCRKDIGLEGIDPFMRLIADIDRRMAELEDERAALLRLRGLAMRSAKEDIRRTGVPPRERMFIYHMLSKDERFS